MPRSLVRTKEEQPILPDGPAEGAAELVLLQGRFGPSVCILEKRIGVENVVADELPSIAVKVVLTGTGHQIGVGDLGAVAGVVLRSLNLEFRNCIRVRDGASGSRAVHGVKPNRGAAIHIYILGAGSEQPGVIHIGGGTRGHREHLRQIAGGQRNRREGLAIHQRAAGGGGRLTELALAWNAFVACSHGKLGIQLGGLRDIHNHRHRGGGFESSSGKVHLIDTGRQ